MKPFQMVRHMPMKVLYMSYSSLKNITSVGNIFVVPFWLYSTQAKRCSSDKNESKTVALTPKLDLFLYSCLPIEHIHWSWMSLADKWANRKILSLSKKNRQNAIGELIIFMFNYHDETICWQFSFGCDFPWIIINYQATSNEKSIPVKE